MVGTGIGLILSFLIVAGSFVPLVETSAGNAPDLVAQANVAPFGVGEVTTPDLTPERFVAALPEEFAGAEREYWGLVPIEDQVHPFSTTSEEFGYVSDTMTVWVIINDLGSEPTVASAIGSVADGNPSLEIEQQSTSNTSDVSFLLANEDQSLHALVWGARDGDWVFSVFASSESVREEFTRTLVDNLQASSAMQSQESQRTPSKSPQSSSVAQLSGEPTETLVNAILNTPFGFSELAPGVYDVEPGERIDGPDPWVTWDADGYADINGGVWLRFYADSDFDGSIQYGVFDTVAEARDAYDVIRDDADLVNSAMVELEDVPGAEEAVIAWATRGPFTPGSYAMSGNAVAQVSNVVVFSTFFGSGDGNPEPWIASAFSLVATGIVHVVPLVSSQEQAVTTKVSETPAIGTTDLAGATFNPDSLDVQLGDTVSVEVAMPNTDFGGLYDLNLLIPPQFQLASDPVCISNAESCINFDPEVIAQLDGSTAIVISGYYGLTEPGRFALELAVVDVPQLGGPRVIISARLAFYTGHVEYDPVDTWLEVNFE